jgi:hypothetical protein
VAVPHFTFKGSGEWEAPIFKKLEPKQSTVTLSVNGKKSCAHNKVHKMGCVKLCVIIFDENLCSPLFALLASSSVVPIMVLCLVFEKTLKA